MAAGVSAAVSRLLLLASGEHDAQTEITEVTGIEREEVESSKRSSAAPVSLERQDL